MRWSYSWRRWPMELGIKEEVDQDLGTTSVATVGRRDTRRMSVQNATQEQVGKVQEVEDSAVHVSCAGRWGTSGRTVGMTLKMQGKERSAWHGRTAKRAQEMAKVQRQVW